MKSINSEQHEKNLAYGQIFKNLRISKGFTQAEASRNIIAPTHLSNFENGRTMVSVNHFFDLLQNINVNMFEFQNTLNQYLKKRDILLFNIEMANALVENNPSKLRRIVKELYHQLNSQSDENNIKLKLDYIRAKSTLSYIDNDYSVSKEEIAFLENYLFHLSEWGQYDIALLGQCAKFIDLISLMQLTKNMLSPFQDSIGIPYIKQAVIQTVLNIIDIYEKHNAYNSAKKLIKYLEDYDIHDYYMFEKLTLIYSRAKCEHHDGDKKAIEIMNKCQSIFEFCDCSQTANWIDLEIKKL
ncbi:Rgg/GadR/MutR family transcriptional regulator [Lactococcus lactis]|jgi:Rgg/GadR/MutR family transcriptional activator|uniref:Rgg/GadR/MutR family transcriptional regulator n=1 Tax=Lactococcus lactis TaxID=1358 RepID=UPI001BAAD848|nr:Rgg/GadR/MutR family transcriptional regulator [Lactococcus lactis]MDT3324509.1 helix-turn-helix domain-containing protein [Bacillota bacterium]MBR8680107.1 helix-turn-helix domain-containing protein [Lactococcus lactis subsp. lactis]MBR8682467.1 helix-turn-helix domain-containing protein [Lactococcus lactis subsp. lactis]MBR8687539.1 helix-turn-helix domain-containing protein [Lactococcus lactis subsp. lactis]MBS3730469.1 helix-turn-helix domain-containing protein [Lactococcus lactis subsp